MLEMAITVLHAITQAAAYRIVGRSLEVGRGAASARDGCDGSKMRDNVSWVLQVFAPEGRLRFKVAVAAAAAAGGARGVVLRIVGGVVGSRGVGGGLVRNLGNTSESEERRAADLLVG